MTKQQLPEWNTSVFYKNIKDSKIQANLKAAEKSAINFAKKYRGKLNGVNDKTLAKILAEYEDASELVTKPYMYGFLLFSMDSSDSQIGAFYQSIKIHATKISEHFVFFDLELLSFPDKKLMELANAKPLTNYKRFLERLIKQKSHRLSEKEEIILAQKSLTSRSAFVRLFDELKGKQRFSFEHKGKKYDLNQTEILNLRMSPDRGLRKAAADGMTSGLKESSDINSYILNVLMRDSAIVERFTNYTKLVQSRHEDNEIEEATIQTMVTTVQDHSGIIREYLKIKAKKLGLKQIKFYDTVVPIFKNDYKVTFIDTKKIILDSFKEFDKGYADIASKFFSENRIDVPLRKGKSGGAFCMSASPKTQPYILINFDGKSHDVSTLAHELGHGINGELGRKQNLLNYGDPTILAEVASLFSELILFDYQIKNAATNKEKAALLAEKIEDLAGNVFRGVSVYNFEYAAHKASREEGELSTEKFNLLWIKTQGDMYKDSIDTTGGYEYWWSYIAHFYHFSPAFYYYGYPFGALTALALYAQYKKLDDKKDFVEKYYEFLSVGSSVSPLEKLKIFGFDINSQEYWQSALAVLASFLKDFKRLQK